MMNISNQDHATEYQNMYLNIQTNPNGLKSKHTFKNRSKRWRCLDCENCQKSDCGKCENCLDKTKFGGMNKKRQKCVERLCLNMRDTIKEPTAKDVNDKIFDVKINKPAPKPKDEVSEKTVDSNNKPQYDIVSKMKALFDDPDDEAYWKEFCELDEIKIVATKVDNDKVVTTKIENDMIVATKVEKEVKPNPAQYYPCRQCNATYTRKPSLYHHVYMKHNRKNTI